MFYNYLIIYYYFVYIGVDVKKKKIEAELSEHGRAQGIIFIVGVYDANGASTDVDNVERTFKELNFAVFIERNPTAEEIACLMQAAAETSYPYKYQYVAFYFAGHGGIDKSEKKFIISLEMNESLLYIEDHVINPLKCLQQKERGETISSLLL